MPLSGSSRASSALRLDGNERADPSPRQPKHNLLHRRLLLLLRQRVGGLAGVDRRQLGRGRRRRRGLRGRGREVEGEGGEEEKGDGRSRRSRVISCDLVRPRATSSDLGSSRVLGLASGEGASPTRPRSRRTTCGGTPPEGESRPGPANVSRPCHCVLSWPSLSVSRAASSQLSGSRPGCLSPLYRSTTR